MPLDDRDYIKGKHPPTCTCYECVQSRLARIKDKHPPTKKSTWVRGNKPTKSFRIPKNIVKVILNLTIIAGFAPLTWLGYLLFTQQIYPTTGSIAFIAGITTWILCIVLIRYKYRWITPSFKLTAIPIIAILLILTFAGIEPLATYKDNLINNYKVAQTERAVQEAAATIQALSNTEKEIFNLINITRNYGGLHTIKWSKNLHSLAQEHSQWMAQTGIFKHSNYNVYENIFYSEGYNLNQIPRTTVEGWLESPGHRANLLNSYISHCGIGIAKNGNKVYITYCAE